jgi:ATP-dependent DNA helicase RecG
VAEHSDILSSPLQYIKGVGPKISQIFKKNGISTIEEALYFIPRDYEDRRQITFIANLKPDQFATLLVEITNIQTIRRGKNNFLNILAKDSTGIIKFVWFHAYPALLEQFKMGEKYFFYGQVKLFSGIANISHPDFEIANFSESGKPIPTESFGKIVPIYVETGGLHQKTLRKIMNAVVKASDELEETLPEYLLNELGYPKLQESFHYLHHPTGPIQKESDLNLKRIIFEEFFVLQLGLYLQKQQAKKLIGPEIRFDVDLNTQFLDQLPFTLTNDQLNCLKDIEKDFTKSHPMARLIQGDVGSGKTIIALAASLQAVRSGFQVALLAPTEILAEQHYQNAKKFLKEFNIEVALITHSSNQPPGQISIGTHAIFQKKVEFKNLGLVIIDEQHRFGVEQRAELVGKNSILHPHLLMMTATPIPRTLALTLYGDMDLSLIKEKPKNRIPIKTSIVMQKNVPIVYEKIKQTVARGEQVYIIYPLVDVSEKLELKSATEMFEHLQKNVFKEEKLALLHGRMKSAEKETILNDFKNKKYQILISTTVIEVGIDIPNATMMVIEHPERLGLSQLHQLRGRVGRGNLQSECVLLAQGFVTERLKVMQQTEDGFVIAEEDLKIRGPGEFLGTQQSGLPGFRVGHLIRDAELLVLAKQKAEEILEQDPKLEKPEHKRIKYLLENRWKDKIERLKQ